MSESSAFVKSGIARVKAERDAAQTERDVARTEHIATLCALADLRHACAGVVATWDQYLATGKMFYTTDAKAVATYVEKLRAALANGGER